MSAQPKVLSTEELSASDAKWVTLKKINWQDHEGKKRVWECAERKTRGSSGIDATGAFPPSTVIIEQYRPPIDKFIIEMPAGLMDEGETAEQTAIRELEEETGFKADRVLESTPLLACDPGMSTANMKMVVVGVTFPDKLESPDQKLDAGESIVKRVVELTKLSEELEAYASKGFVIDARLSHFASGFKIAQDLKSAGLF